MSVKLTNLKEFQDMLRRRIAVETRKTSAEVVNKCALQVLIGGKGFKGAVQVTPRTTKGEVRKALNVKHHAWSFGGKSKSTKLLFLLASKALVRRGFKFKNLANWNANVAIMAQRIARARDRSRSFLAAGWLKAAAQLGGRTRETTLPGGRAGEGRAIKATVSRLIATAFNSSVDGGKRRRSMNVPRVTAIVQNALNNALRAGKSDMETYVVRKELEKTLGRLSDKR